MHRSGSHPAARLTTVLVLLLGLAVPASGRAQTAEPDLGDPPTKCGGGGPGGCYGRDVGPDSMDDTSLGDFSISPHLVHVGETITGKISPVVHFGENVLMNFPNLGEEIDGGLDYAGGEAEAAPSSTNLTIPGGQPNSSTRAVCQDGAPTRTVTTCTWTAGAATGGWARASAAIGNPPARGVEEDYFAVSEDGWGISGRVRVADGRGMPGVTVSVAGGKVLTKNPVVTNKAGDYYFLVAKGTYTVSAAAAVCVEPKGQRCSRSSSSFKVPGSRAVNFTAASEGVIEGTVRDAQARPISDVTIHVVGPAGNVVTTDQFGHYRTTVPAGTYTIAATKQVDVQETNDAGEPVTVKREQTFCSARTSGGVGQRCLRLPRVRVPPDQTVDFTPEEDPGILVAIRGDETIKSGFLKVRVTLSNPGRDTIGDLTFAEPTYAMSNVAIGPDNLPSDARVLSLVEGPTPKPPTSLPAGASVSMDYRFVALEIGRAELAVDVEGTVRGRDEPIKGTHHATATVSDRDVTPQDIDRAIVDGIEDGLAKGAEGLRELDGKILELTQVTSMFPTEVTAADVTAARDLGLPSDLAGFIKQTGADQLAFLTRFGTTWLENVHESGQSGGQVIADMVAAMEDPVTRRQAAEAIWEAFKAAPEANRTTNGYLAEAIKAAYTVEGWRNIISDNTAFGERIARGVYDAGVGAVELRAAALERARVDPDAYRDEVADAWADGTFAVAKEVVVGVAGEGVTRGIFAAGGKLAGGLRALRSTPPVTAAVDATAELAGAGAISEATRRMALGESAARTIQELPYGTALDEAALVSKAGILAEDAKAITAIIDDAEKRWPGLDLEIIARTSEPLSAGLEGEAKREFVKPKAVSVIDKILGAEDTFGGRSSVFKPKMPSQEALEALEHRHPGIVKKIEQRFQDQAALYADEWDTVPTPLPANPTAAQTATYQKQYAKYEKSLRFLADESQREANAKGITVLVSRAGQPVPHGLRYLEQLDDQAFRAARGISDTEATQLKRQLQRHPDKAHLKLETETRNGTITFSNGLTGKPIVSDLDLQAVRPRSGVWPKPPPTRADVENFVNRRMATDVKRFPFHGASDSANDLPSDYFAAAAKFKMAAAHSDPKIARAAAEQIAGQFRTMARLTRDKAGRISEAAIAELERAPGGQVQAEALRQQKQGLLDKAAKFDELADPDAVQAKWPAGEKAVSFTSGGPRVSAGTTGR